MKVNFWNILVFVLFNIVLIGFFIILAVISLYNLIFPLLWFFFLYRKNIIYKVKKDKIVTFNKLRFVHIEKGLVTKVYAKRSFKYRGFIFEYSDRSYKKHSAEFSFNSTYEVVKVLNYIDGYYPIDVKSFEKIFIEYKNHFFVESPL